MNKVNHHAIIVVLLFSVSSVIRVDADEVIEKTGGNLCIPKKHFGVKDLRPWDPKEKLIRILGKPKKITESTDVDDGGEYKVFTYHYEHIRVDLARNEIDKILLTSNKLSMSSNIRTGITKKELSNILDIDLKRIEVTNNNYSIVRCAEKDIWYMDHVTFIFNEAGILREIKFEANRP